ncbi:alpha-glucan family phosphorylase [Flavitalea sp. BT771]|uniref:alpha-glucan family phosphorylase n=1 Tax=Flavitalea sp. BT771 TaxID=3063329 RepID=UPI0026E2BE57|nr:alpha-glucan family phosphorylase [Flavitalea sp. BT771]MDO6429515.1 alpha-glucan family phosphorylase [Flavitalea sp. BT771]MDV6218357.1 alpha-glucan family phosphorylase [Flavitalea sp. BT771]
MPFTFKHPYTPAPGYSRRVAYFCMEYAIHQPLKIYAGGLGFLAGSYLRSAFELKQNLVGIGILWKYGYYDQVRKSDQTMDILFEEKVYGFLQPTDIKFAIRIFQHDVWVTAWYLPPEVFNTAPLFLLSTNLPENDYLANTISHKLYDFNPETRIAAAILLGVGGARLLEELQWQPEVYHLNESHGLPLAFYLYSKHKNLEKVKQQLVFTNHTPEEGGNPKSDVRLLEKASFFSDIPVTEVRSITHIENGVLDLTMAALHMSGVANGVSRLHQQTLHRMWKQHPDICPILSITNAQNYTYWSDKEMYKALSANNDEALQKRKLACKEQLFELVADQNGEIFKKDVLTLVFAKRYTGYKRADLLLRDMDRFDRLVNNRERPVQIIWAGKPYPMDYTAIGVFDKIVNACKSYANCSVMVGYELKLSKMLKQGADVWLNLPRMGHEASGTSGMTAAMNGAINLSLPDGWFPEFARDKRNCFVIPPSDPSLPEHQQDDADAISLYNLLEKEVIPMYYDYPASWREIIKNGMRDIVPTFDSGRMAAEYYKKLYNREDIRE